MGAALKYRADTFTTGDMTVAEIDALDAPDATS